VWRRSGGAAGTGAVRGGPLRPAFGNPGRVARSRGRPGGALSCADGRILVSLTIAQAGPFGVSIFWTPAERRVPARRDRRDSRGGLSLFPIENSRDVQPPVGRRPSAARRDVCRLADRPLAGSNGPGWDAAGGAALSSHSAAQNAACGRAVGRSQRRGGTSGRYARHVCAAIDPLCRSRSRPALGRGACGRKRRRIIRRLKSGGTRVSKSEGLPPRGRCPGGRHGDGSRAGTTDASPRGGWRHVLSKSSPLAMRFDPPAMPC
jgi:hypothetical protein